MVQTRVTVAVAGDEWAVRRDGVELFREPSKRVAVREARRIARESGHARLDVQTRRHGTWRTEATY